MQWNHRITYFETALMYLYQGEWLEQGDPRAEGTGLLLQDGEPGVRSQGPPQQHTLHRVYTQVLRGAERPPPPPRGSEPRPSSSSGVRSHIHLLLILQVDKYRKYIYEYYLPNI